MNQLNNDMRGFKRRAVGKKEEFNEELLYELYKEKPFDNSQEFRGFIFRQHGVYASTNLITRITNYQIRKYGCIKSSGTSLIPIILGSRKSSNRRHKEKINRQNNNKTKSFLKRTDRRKYNDELKRYDDTKKSQKEF